MARAGAILMVSAPFLMVPEEKDVFFCPENFSEGWVSVGSQGDGAIMKFYSEEAPGGFGRTPCFPGALWAQKPVPGTTKLDSNALSANLVVVPRFFVRPEVRLVAPHSYQ
ncbi:hypothetical protein BJ912DRAFT_934659 [Pholiota molesta]|nr:hypothetical protein BJ912DRAFT_934659 [Pholiota molesta]